MPSFLNKVFGYKKHDDKEAARPTRDASDNTLLDGKYEAILPVLSPSAATFAEAHSNRDPDRDLGFSLFKPKHRGVSRGPAKKQSQAVPHLTLHLPGPKGSPDSRTPGIVFEADPDSLAILDDAVIAAKRLSPLEALTLVRACAQAITERGVDTLGIMHPHWLSASPDIQRKLISLFIRSLSSPTQTTTLSPTHPSPAFTFENELHYARSPHDVAAVLRWGLRHLSLEDGHFGKDSAEWAWYNSFFRAERDASYPPKAFSQLLLPQLPPSHTELLTATLSLISSLASHAETNGISGSKLSKFLGLWLLLATRAEQSDDWNQFYARWERAGRILEHLFLARLREESFEQCLPTRLQELVKHYPYNKGPPSPADELLSRPRFSTRRYDALFVRIETVLTHSAEQPKQHPIQLLLEAFHIPVDNPSGDEYIAFWNALKTTAFDSEGPQFTRILVDETVQLLSLIPAGSSVPTSPAPLTSPISRVVSRKRSSSLTKLLEHAFTRSNPTSESTPVSPTSPSSAVITDWTQFSLQGFGDIPTTQPLAVLPDRDDDVEVTRPRISRKSSQRGKSRTRRRRSEDHEPLDTPPSPLLESEPPIIETKLGSVHVVQIDEAFIDFWSDAIVDPISASWPTFVVCGLKQIPSVQQPVRWLVIEQTYRRQQPPRVPSPDTRRGRSPRPSFKSDISGFRINTMFSSARKRFSVFSKSATDLSPKKSGGKNPITGELGEILVEEEPTHSPASPTQADRHVNGNGAIMTAVIGGAIAGVADHLKVDLIPTLKAVTEVPSVEPTPQSGGGHNGSSEPPRWPVNASEDAAFVVEQEEALDLVNPKVDNTANPVEEITAPPPHAPHSWSTQPVLTAEHSIQAERIAVGAVDGAKSAGGWPGAVQLDAADVGLREAAAEADLIPPVPLDTGAVAVATVGAADANVLEPTTEGLPSQKASADLVAASTVESIGRQETEDPTFASAGDPDSITSEADGAEEAKEVAEVAEVPTPAPEPVALVEETPSPDVFVATCAVETVVEGVASQPVTAESRPASEAQASLEAPFLLGIIPAEDTSVRAVTDGTEHAATQVPDLEAQSAVQGTVVRSAEVDVASGAVSAGQDSENVVPVEAEAQTAPESFVLNDDAQGPTPTPEHAAAHEPVDTAPVVASDSGVVEASVPEPRVEAVTKEAPLLTQAVDTQPVEATPIEYVPEAAISPSAAADEVIAVKAEAQPTVDLPAEDTQAQTPAEVAPEITADEPTEAAPAVVTDPEPVEKDATEVTTGEEAHVVAHATFSASDPVVIIEDPVGQDVEAVVGNEEPSSAPTSQFVDEATHHAIAAGSAAKPETHLEPEDVRSAVDAVDESQAAEGAQPDSASGTHVVAEENRDGVDASETETETVGAAAAEPEEVDAPVLVDEDVPAPVEAEEPSPVAADVAEGGVASQPDAATPAIETDDAGEVDGPPEQVELPAEQSVASDTVVSADEPTGPSDETTPAEP